MIDSWSSNSIQLPRLLPSRSDVRYPLSETEFLRIRRTHDFNQIPMMTSPHEELNSVLIQKITLSNLLSEIARLNKASAGKVLDPDTVEVTTIDIAQKLYTWHDGLPESLQNTPENLAMQAASGSGGAFVALHIGFYHFSQLLFYQYLHQSSWLGYSSSPRFSGRQDHAEKCRESSTSLCELLYAAQSLPGAKVYVSIPSECHLSMFPGRRLVWNMIEKRHSSVVPYTRHDSSVFSSLRCVLLILPL